MAIAPLDLAVLVVYMAATIVFGLYMGRGQKSAQDYLLGGRNLPWGALLLSIVATETSTATFLSVPGIAFGGSFGTGDLRFLQLPMGFLVGRTIAAFTLLPLYFRGELFTAYDVLRVRSGPAVRTLASGLFLLTRTLADGLRLYLAALVLQVMFGWSLGTAVLALGTATIAYTALGGMRTVVWTDVVQFAVYMVGAVVTLLVLGSRLDGGLGGMLQTAHAEGHLRTFDFAFDLGNGSTFWAGLIGGAVLSIGTHGVDQLVVQRYLSARSLQDARRALLWSGPLVLLQFLLFLVIGLALASFYRTHTPAVPFTRGDQVFADFIVHHLPTGLVGIVLGAVFSAAMSTLSSSLSASASALVNDFVLPLTKHTKEHAFALRAARGATLLFGGLQMAVGISGLGGADAVVRQVLLIATVTTGVILGLFVLALRSRRTANSSLWGLVAGLAAIVGLLFVPAIRDLHLADPWYGVVTCGVTVLVGVAASRLGPARTRPKVPPDHMTTARLLLQRWRPSDAPELRELLDQNDGHLRPWIPFMKDEPRSLDATREYLASIVQSFERGEHHRYAIRDLTTRALLGETMVLGRGGPGTREIGYWLDQRHCGRGLATEAAAVMPDLAFAWLDAERVILRCDERNLPSLAVARRLGAVPIGSEELTENGVAVRLVVLAIARPQGLEAST